MHKGKNETEEGIIEMSIRLIDDIYATDYYLITADDLGPLSESTSSVR